MQEYKDSIQNYLGASCEVLKLDNQLLFAGSIHQYDDIEDEITVSIRNGNETSQGIVYHTPVKLHVHTNISMNKVLLLYGLVSRCAADFWRITLKHTFSCAERRSSFRQPISAEAVVYRGTDMDNSTMAPCNMIDISLTGLCFSSQEQYSQGEQIVVSSLQLRRGGYTHSFVCTVQRIQPIKGNKFRYGCRYNAITERQEDLLFQDMFSLQVKAFNRH